MDFYFWIVVGCFLGLRLQYWWDNYKHPTNAAHMEMETLDEFGR